MGRHAALKLTPDQLQSSVDAYFKHCEDSREERELKSGDIKVRYRERPCMTGLGLWLNISPAVIDNYISGEYPSDDPKVVTKIADILARAREKIIQHVFTAGSNGDMDTRLASAMLARFGVTDRLQDAAGTLTIKWAGVDPSDAERYSK